MVTAAGCTIVHEPGRAYPMRSECDIVQATTPDGWWNYTSNHCHEFRHPLSWQLEGLVGLTLSVWCPRELVDLVLGYVYE